jgi:hypothetical protein
MLNRKSRKGSSRTTDLVTLAESWRIVAASHKSRMETLEKLGVSDETLRVYQLIPKLDPRIRALVEARKIDSLETIEAISRIHEGGRRLKVAEATASHHLSTKQARSLVQLLKANPKLEVGEAVQRVLREKPEEMYVMAVGMDDETMRSVNPSGKVMSWGQEIKIDQEGEPISGNLSAKGRLLLVSMSKKDYSKLKELAKRTNASTEELIIRGLKVPVGDR